MNHMLNSQLTTHFSTHKKKKKLPPQTHIFCVIYVVWYVKCGGSKICCECCESVKAFHGGENYGLAEWRNGHRRARLLLRAQR